MVTLSNVIIGMSRRKGVVMIKEPMFISPRTFRGYEQYKTDCARASGWNEAMAFIFAEELETERSRTIREKFFVVENVQTERSE